MLRPVIAELALVSVHYVVSNGESVAYRPFEESLIISIFYS